MNRVTKKIFDGKERPLKRQKNLAVSFGKNILTTVCEIAEKERFHSDNRGSILIEFAICMPVFVILLFYINDLVRLKRWRSQTEFVAQQMANIIQNISQKRNNKKITANDIKYAVSTAYLSAFPGTSRFTSDKVTKYTGELGYNPLGYIYCVQGITDSTAKVLWAKRFHMAGKTYTPNKVVVDDNYNRSNIKISSNVSPSEIYPLLRIEKDQIKIIIECAIHYAQGSGYSFADGRLTANVSPAHAFGLRLYKLAPPVTRDGATNDAIYFHSAVIFTPNPELFNETAPV